MNLELGYSNEFVPILHGFIKKRIAIAQARRVLLGLSGGLDSSVVAKLVADAAGKEMVLVLIMPVKETSDTDEAIRLAEEFGIEYKHIDLEQNFRSLVTSYSSSLCISPGELPPLVTGNLSSRLRMTTLYFSANLFDGMVMGTSNKTELLTGYFTKYGDGGTDAMPLGDLYKTQVFKLAEDIGVPERIIEKPPTAGFYQEQTDEGELGIDYATLDKILYGLELRFTAWEIAGYLTVDVTEISRIETMVQRAAHKRFLGMVPKIGIRTPGFDWRENMDFGLE